MKWYVGLWIDRTASLWYEFVKSTISNDGHDNIVGPKTMTWKDKWNALMINNLMNETKGMNEMVRTDHMMIMNGTMVSL